MSALIIPFPKAGHVSREIAGVDPLWQDYQRDMEIFLAGPSNINYIRALFSYGAFATAFDPASAAENIEAFRLKHGTKFGKVG